VGIDDGVLMGVGVVEKRYIAVDGWVMRMEEWCSMGEVRWSVERHGGLNDVVDGEKWCIAWLRAIMFKTEASHGTLCRR